MWRRGQNGNNVDCLTLVSPSRDWSSSCCHNPHWFLQTEFEALSLRHWNPALNCLFLFSVVPPTLSTCECGAIQSTSHCLATCPLHLSCLFLPVWMKVSSLTPWLSDFHTIQFSGYSGCFLFLNWLFPSFVHARRQSVSMPPS